jgi:hypothetical protein
MGIKMQQSLGLIFTDFLRDEIEKQISEAADAAFAVFHARISALEKAHSLSATAPNVAAK